MFMFWTWSIINKVFVVLDIYLKMKNPVLLWIFSMIISLRFAACDLLLFKVIIFIFIFYYLPSEKFIQEVIFVVRSFSNGRAIGICYALPQ